MLPGDANRDGRVDVGDLGILAAHYGLTGGAAWDQGDFNGDHAVDVGDLGILAAHYGAGAPCPAAGGPPGAGELWPVFMPDCGLAGLPLMGLALAGVIRVGREG